MRRHLYRKPQLRLLGTLSRFGQSFIRSTLTSRRRDDFDGSLRLGVRSGGQVRRVVAV